MYKSKIKEKCNNFTKNKIQSAKTDKKKLWKCIQKLIKPSNNSLTYHELEFNGRKITDKTQFATEFNNYFVSSLAEIVTNIPHTPYHSLIEAVSSVFDFKSMSVDSLYDLLKKFKNKSNKDDLLTTSVLKDSFDIVGFFFTSIINESFKTGEVPNYWKTSTIVPIPKIKNTSQACNFRPINILPITEKLLESSVKVQFLNYVEINNILNKYQSGFRYKHSCETSLCFVLTNWKGALDVNQYVIAVFLDFKRAFETIDTNILLKKTNDVWRTRK